MFFFHCRKLNNIFDCEVGSLTSHGEKISVFHRYLCTCNIAVFNLIVIINKLTKIILE